MVKKRTVFLFTTLSFIFGAIGTLVLLWGIMDDPLAWNRVRMGITDPDCSIVLNYKLAHMFPPSEYDRSLTIHLLDKKKVARMPFPPDTGGLGHEHVPVYIVEGKLGEFGSRPLILLVVNDGAVLFDPAELRMSEFQLARPDPAKPGGMDLVAEIASEDWEEVISLGSARYIASFDHGRYLGGWGVARYEQLVLP